MLKEAKWKPVLSELGGVKRRRKMEKTRMRMSFLGRIGTENGENLRVSRLDLKSFRIQENGASTVRTGAAQWGLGSGFQNYGKATVMVNGSGNGVVWC